MSKSVWVAHQDLLLGLETHLIELSRVIAADAGAGRPTEAIVGETFAVELQAAAFSAVARFAGHQERRCSRALMVAVVVGWCG